MSRVAANVNIDLNKVPQEVCNVCKGHIWKIVYIVKRLSSLISPTGKETVVPIQVFACDNCSTVHPMFANLNDTEELPASEGESIAGHVADATPPMKEKTTESGLILPGM